MRSPAEHLYLRFTELVTEFYLISGWDKPPFTTDADTAVAFRATIDGVELTIGYDPRAGETCLFVYCVLGEVHEAVDARVLRRLLECNLAMLQRDGAAYCIDAETAQLACYARCSPNIELPALHGLISMVAGCARKWATNELAGEPRDEERDGPPHWARLA